MTFPRKRPWCSSCSKASRWRHRQKRLTLFCGPDHHFFEESAIRAITAILLVVGSLIAAVALYRWLRRSPYSGSTPASQSELRTPDGAGNATHLPADLERFIATRFAPEDRATAQSLLAEARIETGAPASEHLLRCAAFASRGDVTRLRRLVAMLAIDWRDVVVAGECEMRDGRTVHVRDLRQPFPR